MDHDEMRDKMRAALSKAEFATPQDKYATFRKVVEIATEYHQGNPYVVERLGPPQNS